MTLKDYQNKRDFDETSEPKGKIIKEDKGELCFVVQKHHASHLHYDFRLEVGGVLVSWAVPKGPSMNPADKRLAMKVEDHPLEYRTFEGTIPEGNYGAGTVIVWDEGTYSFSNAKSHSESEREMKKGLKEGQLTFVLHGHKLKGEFSLIRLKGDLETQWLLIKKRDSEALKTDIRELDTSVRSNRRLEDISKKQSKKENVPVKKRSEKPMPKQPEKKLEPVRAAIDSLHLTHLDKVYWPEEGYTKGELLHYYQEIASYLLPYLKDRPESLHRYPNGIGQPGFYQKEASSLPEWIRTEDVQHEGHSVNYAFVEDLSSLLYLVNLGCIDFNPFNSRLQSLDYPDYMILDLDPEDISFEAVIETAQVIHKILKKINVVGFCKTSGSTGLHVFVPLGAQYTYEQAKKFSQLLAIATHQELPNITSLERLPSQRQKKVYLDYLQNNFSQTIAAPYSVRPKPGATVSTPLKWSEVKAGLDPTRFTIQTVFKRVEKIGDVFKPVLGAGIPLEDVLEKLEDLIKKKK